MSHLDQIGGWADYAHYIDNCPPHLFLDLPTALLAMQAAAKLHDGQRRQCLCLETFSTSPLLREKSHAKWLKYSYTLSV